MSAVTTPTTPFAHYFEGLVADARASRDGAFNTLDAINRQTRAVSDGLVREVDQLLAAERAAEQPPDPSLGGERDARFDPEDEWDLPTRSAAPPPDPAAPRRRDDDDEDGYPQTWLR